MQALNWTDERVETLGKLWEQGLSASQIAAEMGGVSRNAVIGKVHRLGLAGRVKLPGALQAKTGRPPKATNIQENFIGNTAIKHDFAPIAQPIYEGNVIPMGQRCDIMGLKESTCRYPVGDPGAKDFYYCGGKSDSGVPYCAFHSKITYQQVGDRAKRELKRIGFR
jgi:GcrA cell cycle regulator